jgi:hypothetical protein
VSGVSLGRVIWRLFAYLGVALKRWAADNPRLLELGTERGLGVVEVPRRNSQVKYPLRALVVLVAGLLLMLAGSVGLGQAATKAAPVNTAPPTISGTPTVSQTLTAGNGTWSNTPTSYAYQWLRCNGGGNSCGSVANGTAKTYTLVGADAGHTIRVRVTATNTDGSGSAQSDQTTPIAPATSSAAPKNTSTPSISGTPRVGEQLTADDGTWAGNPTSFAYQWQRCDADIVSCADVIGATGKTYGVSLSDLGYRLRIKVTAKNTKGSTTATSALTTIVAPVVKITNHRPTLTIVSVRFSGSQVYARFRICDDSFKNLTIIETDSRPGKLSFTRRFSTLTAPRPCGVYTRHWLPVARFRGPGRYTVTLRARDKSGLTSLPARRSFSHG